MPQIEHRELIANGIQFHVAISGNESGPALLCLHGFPEGWMSWKPLMERFPEARIYAPTLRGYPGSEAPSDGYDVFTLTDDVKALIEALNLDKPILIAHDWGGELAWLFAHRYGNMIQHFVAINAPHLKTLARAVITMDDFQALRIPWLATFQIPELPERIIANPIGRQLLRLSIVLREGRPGSMDRALVDDMVNRFKTANSIKPPIEYYRDVVATHLNPIKLKRLLKAYKQNIPVPITLIWGMKDRALTAKIALKSERDAGREIEWRPLENAGHFVSLDSPDQLTEEIRRITNLYSSEIIADQQHQAHSR